MKILNFGSLNIDHVYHVDHFARPGETISTDELDFFCGGKGLNQSIALARAGAQVYHAGKIGKDGDSLKKMLLDNGVNIDYLACSTSLNGHALIQVNPQGQNCIICYGGSNKDITEEYVDQVISNFGENDILLIQNEVNCIEYIAKKCSSKKMKVAFNPSPINAKLLDNLSKIYPESTFLLTLGKSGVIYRDESHTYTHGIYNIPVVDTTAAGDTFTGYFLACYAAGEKIEDCLRKASIASSLAVSKDGASASIPVMEEVVNAQGKLAYIDFPGKERFEY